MQRFAKLDLRSITLLHISGKDIQALGLFIINQQGARRFARSKFLKQQVFKRSTAFRKTRFDFQAYFSDLE